MHLFAVIVWLGGMLFQAVMLRSEAGVIDAAWRERFARFQPFVWMCIWTILVTGIAMMLFDPRFVFFRYDDTWSVLLGLKQAVFVAMVFFAVGQARMWRRSELIRAAGEAEQEKNLYDYHLLRFARVNVGLAIVAILLAAGMK